MTYLRRQMAVRTVKGLVSHLTEGTVFPYKLTDVQPKYVLKLGSGLYSSDSIELNASDTASLTLPAAYTNTNQLACFIRSTGIVKVTIADPALGTSKVLIKGTAGATKGDHKGILMWQGRVNSISLAVPAGSDDLLIDYFLWQIPDLTLAASWQLGAQALGVVP